MRSDHLQELISNGDQHDARELLSLLFEEDPFDLLATQIWGVVLFESLRCRTCNSVSENGGRDRGMVFKFLHVETPDDIMSLPAALRSFTSEEFIDEGRLDGVCSHIGSTKRLLLDEVNSTLLIHLKRSDANGNKLSHQIDFPARLDISPFCTAQAVTEPAAAGSSVPSLQLHGLVMHRGESFSSGHYYAYRRVGTLWYKCDDSIVTPVSEEIVFGTEAKKQVYLLLYIDENARSSCITTDSAKIEELRRGILADAAERRLRAGNDSSANMNKPNELARVVMNMRRSAREAEAVDRQSENLSNEQKQELERRFKIWMDNKFIELRQNGAHDAKLTPEHPRCVAARRDVIREIVARGEVQRRQTD